MTTAHPGYLAARDFLLAYRADYDTALRDFQWPAVSGPFNWATDFFDPLARGNAATALWIVEEDGREERYTFEEMATRSDRLAALLRDLGVGRGDPILVMLGNQVELWDAMLAIMKVGAIIAPTTTALGGVDVEDRVRRAGAKGILLNPEDALKAAGLGPETLRLSVGPVDSAERGERGGTWTQATAGFHDIRQAQSREDAPACQTVTDASDPLLLYFTSGTTRRPKLVEHTQVSYPVGHLSTMYWLGL
ncbi:MAG TPA: AMP-binding protein, partial [Candidatus Lustribacter sp.]|nr:AMP-binding protein [Candidatus Lustribacter sp.]